MKKKLLILFLFLPFLLFSQQKKQPTIGLVLSGGGAKGFAHVAVLKEIDKAGIQLDYIGGTSMGAIVGAFYAAGYTADQIEKIIVNTNFVKLLQDKIPRKSKPFFEKENGEKHTVELPIKNGEIGFPKGFSKGQNILNFLTRYLAPVEDITDFKKLPIPFFCVATDISTGEAVVLENGSLPLSLRASSSFPTLLYPVELNGKLLVDGGVANNFPVDVMRKKGIDIIIGVDVQGKLAKKENLTSVLAILNQVVSFKMYKNNKQKKAAVDVYLHPDISDFSVVSFDQKKGILKNGATIAKRFKSQLDSIATLQKGSLKKREVISLKSKKFLLNQIAIQGNVNYTRTYVLGTLKLKTGDTITYNQLTQKINNLTATDNFSRIDYTFKKLKNGKRLILHLKENDQSANIKLGIHYDVLYKSAVLINYNQKHIWRKNDVLSIDFMIGDNLRYNFDYYIDNGFYWSFGFKSRYNTFKTNVNLSSPISRLNVNYRDFTNKIYAKSTFDRKLSLGFGFEHKYIFADSDIVLDTNGNPTVYDKSHYFNGFVFVKLDTYDDKYFMNRGYFVDLRVKWYMASSDYKKDFHQFSQAKGKIGFATPFSKRLTFKYESEAGFSLGDVTSNVFDFSLGGYNLNYINNFVPFYGYEMADISNQTFLKSTFFLRYNLTKKHYATFAANFARVDGNVFKGLKLFNNIKSGYALGYSVNTLVGPIALKYTWSPETKKNYWLFNLGFWF